MTTYDTDVLIIGAGLAGLMAANALQNQLLRVIVVEKESRVGGRLATEPMGPGRADAGAQFFTTRTPEFQRRVENWLTGGLVYRWSTGWSDGSLTKIKPYGHYRFAVHQGMSALAEHLAQGVDIRLNSEIVVVKPVENGWRIEDANGQVYAGRALVVTAPAPQTLALLDANQIALAATERQVLERITFAPNLTGLFLVEGEVNLPEPGAIQRMDHPIRWIADNQSKGISPEATVVTVQADLHYSRRLWDASDAVVLSTLEAELLPFLAPTSRILEAHLKRWSYALPTVTHPEQCLTAAKLPPLVFAGDAFGGPLVEGASLSGLAAANAIGAALSVEAVATD